MPIEINYYDIHVQKIMLYDRIRCESFQRALSEIVTPDSAVLDIGAGTGLLSIFAAQAGARVVYAVERTKTAELAQRIIMDNGLSNCIQVIHDDAENVELPERVDIIVSEWLGGYGVDENLLPVIIQARDLWLKPDGCLIPGNVSSWIAPIFDDVLEQDLQFWNKNPYGINLSAIGEQTTRQFQCCRNDIKEEHLMADPQRMWEIDPVSITLEQSTSPFRADLEFTCRKPGRCNALTAWFEAYLSEGNILSNRPSDLYTHWGRWVFPLGTCLDVDEGTRIAVSFILIPESVGQSKVIWKVETDDYSFSSEDITCLTR